MATAAEMFDELRSRLQVEPERTRGVTATYQFVLTGDGGGEWYLRVDDGRSEVVQGTAENPQVTVTMTASDYVGMATRQLSGQELFFSGRMRVVGDQFLAMRLGEITA